MAMAPDFDALSLPVRNQAVGNPLFARGAEAARRAAEDFESVFVSQMLETMFQGIKTDGPFFGGPGERVFRSVMLQEYGKQIAANGGIGVADNVYAEIMRIQERFGG